MRKEKLGEEKRRTQEQGHGLECRVDEVAALVLLLVWLFTSIKNITNHQEIFT